MLSSYHLPSTPKSAIMGELIVQYCSSFLLSCLLTSIPHSARIDLFSQNLYLSSVTVGESLNLLASHSWPYILFLIGPSSLKS